MESDRVTVRLPGKVRGAAERAAKEAGVSLGEWVRSLIEAETGVAVEVRRGLAGATKRQRADASRAGVEKRWGKSS